MQVRCRPFLANPMKKRSCPTLVSFRTPTRRFGWRALHAVVLALAVSGLLADVWRGAHLLLESHLRCPYDGAYMHAGDLPPVLRWATRVGEPRRGLPSSAVPRHDHADCDVFGGAGRFAVTLTVCRPIARRLVSRAPSAAVQCDAVLPCAVLSYAPKLSPPLRDAATS